jgi:hypothetical protein
MPFIEPSEDALDSAFEIASEMDVLVETARRRDAPRQPPVGMFVMIILTIAVIALAATVGQQAAAALGRVSTELGR